MSSDLTNPEALADREPELRALQDAFASAQSDVSPIVLVIGDSGTGKSFLVDTFRREMENLDPNFIAASASGEPMAGRASSFEPIREILEHLIGMTDQRGGAVGSTVDAGRLKHPRSEMLRELLRTARQPLSALLSSPSRELLEAYGIEPGIINAWLKLIQTRSTSIDDPHATLQAVAALLGACPVPLALILDDIQWIDSASLQLFLKLPRQTARHRLIFIATARTDGDAAVQLSGRSTVTDLARAVLREDRNAVIDLNAVRRSRGREFCRELLTTRGFDASDESVDNLLRVTGANALFASDLLHNLGANMDQSHRSGVPLRFGAIKWTQLPPRHSDALQHRILQLSSEASHIIETAAVEGQEFTAEVIAHIHGMDLLKVLEILEIELGRSHRLVEDMSPSATLMSHLRSAHPKLSRFTFTHGYYQHLIYTTRVGNSRRRELHGRVALAMEQLWTSGTEQIAAQLAQHFELAADSERAIPYYATAAQRGLRLADFESAAVCAESGLRLVGHAAGTVSADHLGTLYVSGTTAARVRGDFRHAETLAREGLALPATAVPDRIRMRLKSELARSLYNLDVDFAEAEAQLQEAISLAESLAELSQQADLRRQLGIAFQRQGRFIEAVGQYLKALDIVPADDPGIVVADTVNSVGVTFALLGRNDFAVTCHQSALRLAAAQGDSSRDTLFLNDGAAPLRRLGRISDVRDTVTKAGGRPIPVRHFKSGRGYRAAETQIRFVRNSGRPTGREARLPLGREQAQEGRRVERVELLDPRQVAVAEAAQDRPELGIRQPVGERHEGVDLDREALVRGGEHHLAADPADLADERHLLLVVAGVLDDGVADPDVEVVVRQRDRAQVGLQEGQAGELPPASSRRARRRDRSPSGGPSRDRASRRSSGPGGRGGPRRRSRRRASRGSAASPARTGGRPCPDLMARAFLKRSRRRDWRCNRLASTRSASTGSGIDERRLDRRRHVRAGGHGAWRSASVHQSRRIVSWALTMFDGLTAFDCAVGALVVGQRHLDPGVAHHQRVDQHLGGEEEAGRVDREHPGELGRVDGRPWKYFRWSAEQDVELGRADPGQHPPMPGHGSRASRGTG